MRSRIEIICKPIAGELSVAFFEDRLCSSRCIAAYRLVGRSIVRIAVGARCVERRSYLESNCAHIAENILLWQASKAEKCRRYMNKVCSKESISSMVTYLSYRIVIVAPSKSRNVSAARQALRHVGRRRRKQLIIASASSSSKRYLHALSAMRACPVNKQ